MSDNTCVCCGRIIPVGRHICLSCGSYYDMQTFERKQQPITNGDRIRQMTDDELVELLSMDMCSICTKALDDNCGLTTVCLSGISEWVKKEVNSSALPSSTIQGRAE